MAGIEWVPGLSITVEAALATRTYGAALWGTSTWGTAAWSASEAWTDISAWVRSIRIDRRFGRYLQGWETGRATVELNNGDYRFSPSNLSGPYAASGATTVRALIPIRIRATWGSVRSGLGAGRVTDWAEEDSGQQCITTATCEDTWAALSGDGMDGLSPVGAGELYGARLHRWLDLAGFVGERDIHPGSVTMQATDLSARPVEGIALTVESEGGAAFIDADGTFVAEHQYSLVENPRSIEVQAVFGDGTGPVSIEVPCVSMPRAGRADLVRNIVSFTRTGGDPQVCYDADSRAMSGDRRETRTGLLMETDDEALRQAAWFLAQYADDEQTFKSITVNWLTVDGRDQVITQALTRRVRDLVEIRRRPDGIDPIIKRCHISGIHHVISRDAMTTTFDLCSATLYQRYAASRWGIGTWGSGPDDPTAAVWYH